jgi:hypothetical protein
MPEGFFQVRLLYKRAAKARPAAPSMKGAAVCMAPESPDEVPDSELSPGPEPVEEAAAREAVEAAEPPAEMADWLTSESSWILSQSIVTLQLFQSWKLTALPEADADASLRKLETAERLADAPALDAAATPEFVPFVGMGITPEPPGK